MSSKFEINMGNVGARTLQTPNSSIRFKKASPCTIVRTNELLDFLKISKPDFKIVSKQDKEAEARSQAYNDNLCLKTTLKLCILIEY